MKFNEAIIKEINTLNSNLCIGLDPYEELITNDIKVSHPIKRIKIFLEEIVNATYDIVPAYKPNLTCFSVFGPDGWQMLKDLIIFIKKKRSDIKVIAECKRTEVFKIGDLAAFELLEYYGFDALNIMPWYGRESVLPYYRYADKGKAVFVIVHDSNQTASELQDVVLQDGAPMYLYVAKKIIKEWNETGNVFIETALTYPQQLKKIVRLDDGRQFFLIVGLGAQGGSLEDLLVFKNNRNFLVSASRGILYVSNKSNFAQASRLKALDYINKINLLLKK